VVSVQAWIRHFRCSGELTFVLIDANARVGYAESPFVGGQDPEEDNEVGYEMHSMVAEGSLCFPSTLLPFSGGCGSWTWQSSHQSRHRIDYIGIPMEWLGRVVRHSVLDESYLASAEHIYHRAVVLDIVVDTGAGQQCTVAARV
jgi:hypothetical protein